MRIGEIIRIIIFIVVGYVFMMLMQPWLYDKGAFGVIKSIRFEEWLPLYNRAALIVFFVSLIFTVGWYVLTLINQNDNNRGSWRLIWYIGLALLVVVISISIYFNNHYPKGHQNEGKIIYETLFSMMGLFCFDSLFLLYWLPTVTSTPALFKNRVVPGSTMINRIVGR